MDIPNAIRTLTKWSVAMSTQPCVILFVSNQLKAFNNDGNVCVCLAGNVQISTVFVSTGLLISLDIYGFLNASADTISVQKRPRRECRNYAENVRSQSKVANVSLLYLALLTVFIFCFSFLLYLGNTALRSRIFGPR